MGAVVMAIGSSTAPAFPIAPSVHSNIRELDVARLDVQLRQSQFAALEATLAAEAHEYDGTLQSPDGQRAAEVAVVTQRRHAVLQAQRDLVAAELAAETANAKNRSAAAAKVPPKRTALSKAEADAAEPLHANFTRRIPTTYPPTSTGRRLALAQWITDRQNPLAARVAVNHIWARHFGQPLVPTVFDFGRNGQPPSHPALLDWLAAEFMERGWSMKQLHRLFVTSRTYRLDSHSDALCSDRDPDNKYFGGWRPDAWKPRSCATACCLSPASST